MEIMVSLPTVAFWASMFFLLLGCLMGLMGIWVEEFWSSSAAIKLMLTNAVFFSGSVGAAILSRWLGTG